MITRVLCMHAFRENRHGILSQGAHGSMPLERPVSQLDALEEPQVK